MDLGVTKKVHPLIKAVSEMVNDEIVPLESEFYQEVENAETRFSFTPRMTEIIEGGNITMKGVNFKISGTDNRGYTKIMYPGFDYKFPGAKYVVETPIKE